MVPDKVVQAAREAGATIIRAPISFVGGYQEISDSRYGILEGSRGLDTFASTNLDFIRRSKGITTIALGGFLTSCCADSTMRSGYERGYEVVTLSDCVAATSSEEHANAIRYDYPMFSKPMSGYELAGAGQASDASRGY